MKFVVMDTCGAAGSVALVDASAGLTSVATAVLPGRAASERLISTIRGLFVENGLALDEVGFVAVVHGPGPFTGVRVGLSAAKGLCEALGKPLVAISRLAVLAAQIPASAVGALLDAGRGEFYFGEYADGICRREALLTREQVIAGWRQSGFTLVGCEPVAIAAFAQCGIVEVGEPTAEQAAPLALQRAEKGRFDDIASMDANYVRRTDAEIFAKAPKLAAGQAP